MLPVTFKSNFDVKVTGFDIAQKSKYQRPSLLSIIQFASR